MAAGLTVEVLALAVNDRLVLPGRRRHLVDDIGHAGPHRLGLPLEIDHAIQHQPVGVSDLARLLDEDKSAIQRDIMTLVDAGWVGSASGTPGKWQLTAHILAVAHMGAVSNDLRQRARGALEALRDASGETVSGRLYTRVSGWPLVALASITMQGASWP